MLCVLMFLILVHNMETQIENLQIFDYLRDRKLASLMLALVYRDYKRQIEIDSHVSYARS